MGIVWYYCSVSAIMCQHLPFTRCVQIKICGCAYVFVGNGNMRLFQLKMSHVPVNIWFNFFPRMYGACIYFFRGSALVVFALFAIAHTSFSTKYDYRTVQYTMYYVQYRTTITCFFFLGKYVFTANIAVCMS